MPGETIRYGILLSLASVGQGAMKSVEDGLKKIGERTEALSRWSRRALLGLAGAVAAVTWAAAEQEKADRLLADALTATGDASVDTFKRMQDLAGAIQDRTTCGDEEVQSLIAQALNFGVTTDRMDGTIKAAIGLSQALGMDLPSALKATLMAFQGQFTMLERQVPALRAAKTAGEKLAIVQDLMAKGFMQAEGQADTLRGRLIQLKGRFGDLLQEIGGAILGTSSWKDTLVALKAKVDDAITWVKNLTAEQKQWIITGLKVAAVTLVIGAVVSPLAKALAALAGAFRFAVSPAGILTGSLVAIGLSALVVAESLGLIDVGLSRNAAKIKAVDTLWTGLADCWLNAAKGLQKMRLAHAQSWRMPERAEEARREIKVLDDAIEGLWEKYRDRRAEEEIAKRAGTAGLPQIDVPGLKKQQKEIEDLIRDAGAGIAQAGEDAADQGEDALNEPVESFKDAAGRGAREGRQAAKDVERALRDGIDAVAAAVGGGAIESAPRTGAERLKRLAEEKLNVAQLLEKAGYSGAAEAKREEALGFYNDLRELLALLAAMDEAERAAIAEIRKDVREMDRRLTRLSTARAV